MCTASCYAERWRVRIVMPPLLFVHKLTMRMPGSISQTLTYPFDVLRRKMQVTGMNVLGYKYNGALDALGIIIRTEGVRGLYRGLWPNLCAHACYIASCADERTLTSFRYCSESGPEYCHVFLHIRAGEGNARCLMIRA